MLWRSDVGGVDGLTLLIVICLRLRRALLILDLLGAKSKVFRLLLPLILHVKCGVLRK